MKNTAKRLLIALLAGVMSIGMVACKTDSGNEQDSTKAPNDEVTTAPEGDEETLGVPADLDFDNTDVNILTRNASAYFGDELWVSDEMYGGDKVANAVYSRYKKIEEDYNLFVKLDTKSNGEISTWYTQQSLSADPKDMYHVVATHGRESFSCVVNGLCADWNMLPYVDLDASWWSQDALAQWTTLSGSVYAMNGDISYLSVAEAVGMFFNKDLITNAGEELPYDLVRNGEWTMENFEIYVMLVGNTLTGDDQYGYMTGWWRGPMNIVYSTGNRWATVTDDDVTVLSTTGNRVQDAFDDYFDLLYKSGYCKMIGGDYTGAWAAFQGNNTVFYDEILMRATNFYGSGLNFGVVPMPKYTVDVDKNYTFVNADTNIFTVPAKVLSDETTAKKVSAFLEAMAYYGQRDVLPTYYNDLLTYRSTTDVDSVEMMGLIRNGLTFDLAYYYYSGSPLTAICDIPYSICVSNGAKSFKTLYDSLTGGNSLAEAIQEWKDLT